MTTKIPLFWEQPKDIATAVALVILAKDSGIDPVVIENHDSIIGALEALYEADESADKPDFTAYFQDKFVGIISAVDAAPGELEAGGLYEEFLEKAQKMLSEEAASRPALAAVAATDAPPESKPKRERSTTAAPAPVRRVPTIPLPDGIKSIPPMNFEKPKGLAQIVARALVAEALGEAAAASVTDEAWDMFCREYVRLKHTNDWANKDSKTDLGKRCQSLWEDICAGRRFWAADDGGKVVQAERSKRPSQSAPPTSTASAEAPASNIERAAEMAAAQDEILGESPTATAEAQEPHEASPVETPTESRKSRKKKDPEPATEVVEGDGPIPF